MPLSEADTRVKLLDPALHARGWTEDLIQREETAGAIEVVDGKPRKQSRGRADYVLRVRVAPATQPVAGAVIEAKSDDLPPGHGLEQAKGYAACKRLNVPLVFSSNGNSSSSSRHFKGPLGRTRRRSTKSRMEPTTRATPAYTWRRIRPSTSPATMGPRASSAVTIQRAPSAVSWWTSATARRGVSGRELEIREATAETQADAKISADNKRHRPLSGRRARVDPPESRYPRATRRSVGGASVRESFSQQRLGPCANDRGCEDDERSLHPQRRQGGPVESARCLTSRSSEQPFSDLRGTSRPRFLRGALKASFRSLPGFERTEAGSFNSRGLGAEWTNS